MSQELTAAEIKKRILQEKVRPAEPVEAAKIFGHEGWLFKPTSFQMEGWRSMVNAVKEDGTPDDDVRKLAPAKLIQISFRDKQGNPVFDELDLAVIGGMPDDQINPLRSTILRINGMNLEGFEDVLKNLLAILGVAGVYALLASIGAPCPSCTKDTPLASCRSNGSASATGPQEAQQRSKEQSSSAKS
jgi:hypothetical protein